MIRAVRLVILGALLLAGPGMILAQEKTMTTQSNPIVYVEIPVTDLDRAVRFYAAIFGFAMERQTVDGYEMAFFPAAEDAAGASGALVKGDVYIPGKIGPIVYFAVANIDPILARTRAAGAKILYEKKHVGAFGYVAEIEDSEGNRIALRAPH